MCVEHQLDADGAERLVPLGLGQLQRVGRAATTCCGDLGDVRARVAVLGGGLALGGGDQRARRTGRSARRGR